MLKSASPVVIIGAARSGTNMLRDILTKFQSFGFILIIIAIQTGLLTVFFYPAIMLIGLYTGIASQLF